MNKTAIRGDIIYTKSPDQFEILQNGYLLIQGEDIMGITTDLRHAGDYELVDYKGRLIIPGFVDLHLHAPQINNLGLGADKELLEWLNTYTFPEESKYRDLTFAEEAYHRFIKKLWKNGITSSAIFGTIYTRSTLLLMDLLERSGLSAYVGKVNMDCNAPDFYIENTTASIEDTRSFVETTLQRYKRVQPIITPRFVPSCSKELMQALGEMASQYHLKIQSHLSENKKEIQWVKELHSECLTYAHVYEKYGLLKENYHTVMAHCVWSNEQELALLHKKQVMVAHSPYSNGNLSSGIAPISKMLSMGIPVGLASDISGGHEMFMGRLISQAAILAKMGYAHGIAGICPLTEPQLFYMATKGGGKFFGKVGSFEPGYRADFLVIDDDDLQDSNERHLPERLQRFLYIGDDRQIAYRYARGKLLEEI